MSYDGGISVKINNSKLKAMLVEAESDGLFIEYFTENEKYDFSFENMDSSDVTGCPKDLDDLKDYILQLIEAINEEDNYEEYCRFKRKFDAEYPSIKTSFSYVKWVYVPSDYDRSDYDDDVLEFKYGNPVRKKASNKKKNGPLTLKEIFPGIDMTKPSGLVVDDDGCCTGYDRKQHSEFLGEENCLFITKDAQIIEDENDEIFDLLTMYDKCVVTSDLEDFGEYYNCGGFRLFYIIDAETNKVVYSSEKDEFCSDTYGLSLSLSLEEEEDDHFNEVLGKYTKCDGSKFYGEIEEDDDEDEKEEEDTSTSPQDKAEDLIDDAEARAENWMQYYGEYIDHNPVIDFDGSLFVFTGFGHRDDKDHPIVQKVIEKGGQYRSKVSGLTNYLVVDPRGAGDTKVEAAIEQREKGKNIQIVLLEDLEKALEGKTTAKKSSATSAKTIATKTSSSKSTSAKSTTKSKRDSSSSGKNSTETSKSSYDIDEITGKLMNYRGRKKDIVLPNGIKIVGEKAFENKKITSVVIPEGVETIEAYAFSSCTSLNSVTLPNTIKKIGEHAFEICKYLTNITIPEGVETIEAYAFYGCWHLNSVTLPNTIKKIGEYAFYSCDQFTSIVIPEGVETIDAYSLSCCENLKSVALPNTLKKIGKSAFFSCEQLTSIVIPEGVETIDDDAFSECRNLKSVTLPNTLKTIGEDAFTECEQLTSIIIPEGVDTIEKGVFSKCNNLDKVVLPSTIKKIGDTAFAWCRNLTSIFIPEGCEEIDGGAFLECEKLKDIYVPNSVHAIGDIAFYTENNDTTVHTIRGSCADISADGDYKVDYQYPTSGTATIVSSRTTYTPTSSSRANATCSNSSNYNTSSGSSSSGKNSAETSNSNYVIDDTNGRLTKYKGGGKAVVLPKGIKIIGERAFENEKIFSIVIPEGVETIEAYAFFGCENLKSVTLPNTLKTIGEDAFSECEQLTNIIIPEGVDSIENEVFYDCYNLNKVVLPSSVKKIGDSAFSFCKLTRIVVPEGCEELGKNAFYMCDKLKDIYVPDSVHTIGKYAFNTDNDDTTVHTIKGSYADISADGDYKVDYQYPTSSAATVVSSKTTYVPTSSSRINETSSNYSNSTNSSSDSTEDPVKKGLRYLSYFLLFIGIALLIIGLVIRWNDPDSIYATGRYGTGVVHYSNVYGQWFRAIGIIVTTVGFFLRVGSANIRKSKK